MKRWIGLLAVVCLIMGCEVNNEEVAKRIAVKLGIQVGVGSFVAKQPDSCQEAKRLVSVIAESKSEQEELSFAVKDGLAISLQAYDFSAEQNELLISLLDIINAEISTRIIDRVIDGETQIKSTTALLWVEETLMLACPIVIKT